MQECWNENPVHRPTFADIVHELDRIVAMSSRDVSTPVPHDRLVCVYTETRDGRACDVVAGVYRSAASSRQPADVGGAERQSVLVDECEYFEQSR